MEDRHLKMVYEILEKYPYDFYAYGSRVKGNPRKFSDLDLCFKDKISWNTWSLIEEDFEESDLPFEVSLIDYNRCDEGFKKLIDKDLQLISQRII